MVHISYRTILSTILLFFSMVVSTRDIKRPVFGLDVAEGPANTPISVIVPFASDDPREHIVLTDPALGLLDDVICLKSGMQIAADCVVLDTPVEVDESLLSGEAEPILKEPGDHMLSGSFLLSGACHARVEHVGIDNYATKIADETRKRKPVSSEMVKVFSKVTRMTSCLVLPLSALLFFEALVLRHEPIEVTVVNTSTALLGMLPVGLVLLASISMMASVVRLGKMKVVVQEMFSIETLSHADTLCLDKTGTLTQGKMKVQSVVPLGDHSASEVERVMTSFVKGSLDSNATFQTLAQHFHFLCA